ncbi:NUDIX domain-containing protein [Alkalicella caledoniensis]|uniref:Bis(5'-nucleosyl)-tetraphosphatase [asymmetrical] n=1 Tax=Alkalicella caledoniensis TaxID=2731377 RepID=A0A7G9WBG3_ALKCA|nr:NUDIX domain-containing protein [Alkalicella caledoniensis]QNO16025.1 NUDIX domain-containing protein [Alkalicella caledoniensis]
MRYEKSCGAVVFRREDKKVKILLLKHINGGHWGLPKGHVEEGETEQETAVREILEETGLKVCALYDEFRYEMEYSPVEGIMKKVVYFVAEVQESQFNHQVEEVEQCIWVNGDEALGQVTYDNTKKLLSKALDFIEKL